MAELATEEQEELLDLVGDRLVRKRKDAGDCDDDWTAWALDLAPPCNVVDIAIGEWRNNVSDVVLLDGMQSCPWSLSSIEGATELVFGHCVQVREDRGIAPMDGDQNEAWLAETGAFFHEWGDQILARLKAIARDPAT